jgi:hypothetical protein
MEVLLPGERPAPGTGHQSTGSNRFFPVKSDVSAKVVTVDKETQWVNVWATNAGDAAVPLARPETRKGARIRQRLERQTACRRELGVRSLTSPVNIRARRAKRTPTVIMNSSSRKARRIFTTPVIKSNGAMVWRESRFIRRTENSTAFVTMDGGVENFVLLPYGITSRENLQESSHLPSTFYGGAIFLNWYSAEANNDSAPPFAVREGSMLEVTLTPEGKMLDGTAGQTIVIRKTLGMSGAFRIHNIPIGRYQISVKANGKPLKIKDNKQYNNPMFGMTPGETIGGASILFVPDGAKASMMGPQFGSWKWISLGISTP